MQISLILHYIFQTANLYSCCFVVYGRETAGRSLPTSLRLAAGQRQELTDRFIFGCYPLSDAKRKRHYDLPFSLCIVCGEQETSIHPSPQTDIYFRNLLIRYTRRVRITITVKILSIPFHITSNACMISSVFILISPFH